MSWPEILYDTGTLFLELGLVAGIAFGLLYGLSAPWWRTPIGRMFIIFVGAIIIAIGTVVAQIVLEPSPWVRGILRIAAYLPFALAMSWILGTFLHERRVERKGTAPVAPELFWVIRRLFRRPGDRG